MGTEGEEGEGGGRVTTVDALLQSTAVLHPPLEKGGQCSREPVPDHTLEPPALGTFSSVLLHWRFHFAVYGSAQSRSV